MNRLYRSRTNRVLFGVCGGLGEYFRIDPTIIRIITILISLSGTGILIYLIASVIMPDESKGTASRREQEWTAGSSTQNTSSYSAGENKYSDTFDSDLGSTADKWDEPVKYNSEKNKLIFGAILVGLGILILGRNILPWLFKLDYFVPLLLIGIGGFIVYRGRRQ